MSTCLFRMLLPIPWGYMRSRSVKVSGNCLFNLLRSLSSPAPALHSSHTHAQCVRLLISPHPLSTYFLGFLTIAILMGMRQHLTVGWTCITLRMSVVEHLFACFLAIHRTSLENFLFKYLTCFRVGVFGFLLLSLGVLYIVCIFIPYLSSVLGTFLTPVFNIDRSELRQSWCGSEVERRFGIPDRILWK